jgi:sugar transferase (PEP-CTERM/EpsH1 system associated)
MVLPAKRPLIAHVIFRLDVGGLENGLVNLINRMPADRFRHAIICIDRSTAFRERIIRDDVEIIEIRKQPGRDFRSKWRLLRVLRRLRPAIVHSRNLGALDALLPALLSGVRSRIHGEHGWDISDPAGTERRPQIIRKLHAPMVTRFVTVSRDLRVYLTDRIGIDSRKISTICNGVDTEKFAPDEARAELREGLGAVFDAGNCVIGTVGRLDPVKGHRDLASAFIQLARNSPGCEHARLVMVGDGPCLSDVQNQLREAGLLDRCWFPGQRGDIARLIAAFDVFVQPSLAEGISNTVLEAMATGLPVVATKVGGNPELVADSETGVLVPPADPDALAGALRDYVSDGDLRVAHGAAARRRAVDVFSIDRMLKEYEDLYASSLP